MKTSFQAISMALDVICQNACRPADLQLPKAQLAKASGVGLPTFNKLIQILKDKQLLFIEGATRNQRSSWNSQRTKMNSKLAQGIYTEMYTESKPHKKKVIKMQYDEIVAYLRSRNWTGTLERVKDNGLIKVVEQLDI